MEDPILLQILKEDPDIEDAEERYRQFVADDELREKYQDRMKAGRIYAERRVRNAGWRPGTRARRTSRTRKERNSSCG